MHVPKQNSRIERLFSETAAAMEELNIEKAVGLDETYPEFHKHLDKRTTQGLTKLFNNIPAIRQTAKSAQKKNKSIASFKLRRGDHSAEDYRPIKLIVVNFWETHVPHINKFQILQLKLQWINYYTTQCLIITFRPILQKKRAANIISMINCYNDRYCAPYFLIFIYRTCLRLK